MKKNIALIFGYNDYAIEIEKNIQSEYEQVYIFKHATEDEEGFDLSDNWDSIKEKVHEDICTVFCVLEDMAENIFLTISLRDTFSALTIIALSQDEESQSKLILAGATHVIPTMQTTANVIVDMLEKPIITEVLHNILYEKSLLKIAQITINDDSIFEGKYPTDIGWSRDHGVIIISLVHEDHSREFIYASHATHRVVTKGDIFVVVGYDADINAFEKLTRRKDEN